MRPQGSGQESGSSEQKKSVFDRLGRQLDLPSRQMSRNSPANYPEHMLPPPPMQHEPEFGGRYGRDPALDMEWRYQSERRHLAVGRERHHMQMPPPMPPRSHYDMEMQSRQAPPQSYYSPHSQSIYPGGSQPPGPPIPSGTMPLGVHQRRSSPKYDRFGNPIRGSTARMDHVPGLSPPRNMMQMGPMMPHQPYDMPPMRPGPGIYHEHRWYDGGAPPPPDLGPNLPPHGPPRLLPPPPPEEQFIDSHRYVQPPQQQTPPLNNMSDPMDPMQHNFEAPRYAKWRERRDVITNLDREAAQSSSRIDSMRSSMQQQPDKREFYGISSSRSSRKGAKKDPDLASGEGLSLNQRKELNSTLETSRKKQPKKKALKTEPQDISDGEIIDDDDEDSSDESEIIKVPPTEEIESMKNSRETGSNNRLARPKTQYEAMAESRQQQRQPYYESHAGGGGGGAKRLRLHEREDYSMDYETISDEELDAFMDEKKPNPEDDDKLDTEEISRAIQVKGSSEMELLNALGLDWANLVEMSKQSRKETSKSSSALPRFAISNYLPTLGIAPELAGPELYEIILKVCS